MFADLVEEGETSEVFFNDRKQAWFASLTADEQLWWLAGQLWQCTDILPGHVCDDLGIPLGSTYAQAARHIRAGAFTV